MRYFAFTLAALWSSTLLAQWQTMEGVVPLGPNNCPIVLLKSSHPIDRYSGKTPFPFQNIDATVLKCSAATLAPIPQSATMLRLNIAITVGGGAAKAVYEASGTLGSAITVDFVKGDPLIQWPGSITLNPGTTVFELF